MRGLTAKTVREQSLRGICCPVHRRWTCASAVSFTPPAGLLRAGSNADFSVDGTLPHTSLLEQDAVFVPIDEAKNLEDDDDQQNWSIAKPVYPAWVGIRSKRAYRPLERDRAGMSNHNQSQRNREKVLDGRELEEALEAIPPASVSWFVVVDRVAQRVADNAPRQKGEEGGGFEASICAHGFRV